MRHQQPAPIHVLSSPVDTTSYVVDIRFFPLAHITDGHLSLGYYPYSSHNPALQIFLSWAIFLL